MDNRKQMEYEAELQKKREYLKLYKVTISEDMKADIENCILQMKDNFLREIMIRHIIKQQTLQKIAEETNYSKRQIERLHIRALQELEITE